MAKEEHTKGKCIHQKMGGFQQVKSDKEAAAVQGREPRCHFKARKG
jgi:hypothetical protein